MKDGLDLEAVRKAWKLKLQNRKADVEREIQRREAGPQVPYISDKCPEKYVDVAERIVSLQVKLGEFSREDLSSADVERIKDMKRRVTGLSFRDNIALMVENERFVNYDVIFARHVLQVLDEFDSIYERFYQEYGSIPMNVFSTDVRLFFKNNKNGLSKEEMLKTILEVYRPELANVKIEHHNYDALPRSRQVIEVDERERIVAELNSIAKNGFINDIFSPKYESYFKELCARLKLAGYTFDEFVNRHTSLDFGYCFKADIVSAVRQMAISFLNRYGTTVGIGEKDPYLRSKIEAAQDVVGIYTIGGLLDYLKVPNDNYENSAATLSKGELRAREIILFKKLEEIYPEKTVLSNFTREYPRVYDELSMLAKRFGFADVNDYLKEHGFDRVSDYNRSMERCIYLSDEDIVYYGFLDGCNHVEYAEQWLKGMGIDKLDPYENLGVYRRLIYEGHDTHYKARQQAAASSQEEKKPSQPFDEE